MNQKLKYILHLPIIVSLMIMTLSAQSNFNFQADIDSQIHENIPGVLLTVISKENEIDWSGASGFSDKVQPSLFRIRNELLRFRLLCE